MITALRQRNRNNYSVAIIIKYPGTRFEMLTEMWNACQKKIKLSFWNYIPPSLGEKIITWALREDFSLKLAVEKVFSLQKFLCREPAISVPFTTNTLDRPKVNWWMKSKVLEIWTSFIPHPTRSFERKGSCFWLWERRRSNLALQIISSRCSLR